MNDLLKWSKEEFGALQDYLGKEHHAISRTPFRREQVSLESKEIFNFIAVHLDKSFSEMLLATIDRKGLTDVGVYKKAQVDRRVFSRLRSSPRYQPSRNTAIRLCLGMELTLDEILVLLSKAGFSLSYGKKDDLVLLYCIQNGIYDINKINEALRALGMDEI